MKYVLSLSLHNRFLFNILFKAFDPFTMSAAKYQQIINQDDEDDNNTTNETEYDTKITQILSDEATQEVMQYYRSLNTDSFSQLTTKKQYEYKSDFDQNGIIYAIGTNFTSNTKWINPTKEGGNRNKRLILTSYPKEMYDGLLSDMIGRVGTNCLLNNPNSESIKNTHLPYLMINFVALTIRPTYYTLRYMQSILLLRS